MFRRTSSSSAHLLMLSVALSGLIACDTPTATAPETSHARANFFAAASKGPKDGRVQAEELRLLATQVPGFTGVFLDHDGVLTVSVAKDDFSPQSLAKVVFWARQRSAGAAMAVRTRVHRVAFDYLQLRRGYDSAFAILRDHHELRSGYIDETRGKLVLGVESARDSGGVVRALREGGLEAKMFDVAVEETPKAKGSLSGYNRPVVGGIRVQEHNGNLCTVGFNVLRWDTGTNPTTSPKYFFTAGHCSGTFGTFGGWPFYQDTLTGGHRIGQEIETMPMRYNDAACPEGVVVPCTNGDVMVVAYDDSINASYGKVAVPGTLFPMSYVAVATAFGPVVGGVTGDNVTMVGMKSGKKTGLIEASCVDVKMSVQYPGYILYFWVLCTQRVGAAVIDGDSGGPVYIPYSASYPTFTPRAVGIISSGTATKTYIIPMSQISGYLTGPYYYE